MGYTHYWTPKASNVTRFNVFKKHCISLHKALSVTSEYDKIVICGGDGTGNPSFTPKVITFNGDGENAYETFYIDNSLDPNWNFCKTARKPYDLLVCACLIAAHEILGYEVKSDGEFEDWKPAIKFYLDTIYGKQPDEDGMKLILPEFLFENQKGTKYFDYKNKYSIMDYVKSLFVVV